ncbi:hypothetical protein ED733_002250 [Metarhizium rileyi]|uniref:Uncharacterized protein n=1 Tax=Metarhizium rileyi (strain RCEF 4871) TaxID=1649241 RepID=A0A5C6G219_METRR|nr:hypothetical protein ED733_002250 [Metarhizium rileyi]
MTGPNPSVKEIEHVKKRISDIMREYTAKQIERQHLVEVAELTSKVDRQLLTAATSSSRQRRGLEAAEDMNGRVTALQKEIAEKDEVIGRLWYKLAELQEKERELTKKAY